MQETVGYSSTMTHKPTLIRAYTSDSVMRDAHWSDTPPPPAPFFSA